MAVMIVQAMNRLPPARVCFEAAQLSGTSPAQAAASPLPLQGPRLSWRGTRLAVTRISCWVAPSAPSRHSSTSPSPGCSSRSGREGSRLAVSQVER